MNRSLAQNSSFLKHLLILSLLTAISVFLERFLGYNDKVLSISIAFLPIALAGMLFGIVPAMAVAALADFLGALLFPSGPLDLRFTLIAAIRGAIYGFFLYRRNLTKPWLIGMQALIILVPNLLMNTLVISTLVGKGFFALLPLRVVKNLLMFPVEVFLLLKMAEYRASFERLNK